jgi:2-succinyl-5-enolpyruvyl-6-hydroxy-3-cyclohexene-1-carboxylate synthase
VAAWVETAPGELVLVDATPRWEEPTFTVEQVLAVPPGPLAARTAELLGAARRDGGWCRSWVDADATARAAIDQALATGKFLSPQLVRTLGESLPAGSTLYLSNSLPVREAEMFLPASPTPIQVQVHRGANSTGSPRRPPARRSTPPDRWSCSPATWPSCTTSADS